MKSKTPEYRVWRDMRQRCQNPACKAFKDYGARGIKVCDRWQFFENFLSDMGNRPAGLSVERIRVNGDYEPENCKWATPTEQSRNLRTHLRKNVGVAFSVRDNSWGAWIAVAGKSIRIGSYATEEDAIKARSDAQRRYWIDGEPIPSRGTTQRNNRSGHTGVCWIAACQKWEAYVYRNRKRTLLGRFTKIEDAVAARAHHGITAAEKGGEHAD